MTDRAPSEPRPCRHCGNPIVGRHALARYCTVTCRDRAHYQRRTVDSHRPLRQQTCAGCGQTFESRTRHRYHDHACYLTSWRAGGVRGPRGTVRNGPDTLPQNPIASADTPTTTGGDPMTVDHSAPFAERVRQLGRDAAEARKEWDRLTPEQQRREIAPNRATLRQLYAEMTALLADSEGDMLRQLLEAPEGRA